MQQQKRTHMILIYTGITILLTLLFPITALFQLIMGQLVSVVWAELNPTAYSVLQIIFVYGIAAAATSLFMVKMRVDKRLQPHYASPQIWVVGCVLFLIVFVVDILHAKSVVSLVPADRQLLGYILIAAKIALIVAYTRVLIGILPRANKNKDN